MIAGAMLGILHSAGVVAGILEDPRMEGGKPFAWHRGRAALIPVGIGMACAEELLMRGYFMRELANARAPTWLQVLRSGLCSAVYHSFHNFTLLGLSPSFFLFTVHAVLYVAGRRSLTRSIIAHRLYHVLNAPYLLMFAMSQMPN
jgi:membrane protease YdiL (CAAX protease family)